MGNATEPCETLRTAGRPPRIADRRAVWSLVGGVGIAAFVLLATVGIGPSLAATGPSHNPLLRFVTISCPPEARWAVTVTKGVTHYVGAGGGAGPLTFALPTGTYTWSASSLLGDFSIVVNATGVVSLSPGTTVVTLICQPTTYTLPLQGSPVHAATVVVPSIPVAPGSPGADAEPPVYDSTNHDLYVPTGYNTIVVINTLTNTVVGTPIPVGDVPEWGAFDPANGYLYFVNWLSANVTVVNGATNTVVVPSIGVGSFPLSIEYDRSNGYLYVANSGDQNVTVINGATNTVVVPSIPVGRVPAGVAYDSSNGYVYVTNSADNNVTVINGATNSVVVPSIPVGSDPQGDVFDASNGYIYVSDYLAAAVTVINGATNAVVVPLLPVGAYPVATAYDPLGGCVSAINQGSNSETTIDGLAGSPTEDQVLVASARVGFDPEGAAFSSLTGLEYVSNEANFSVSSGNVTVLESCEKLNATTAAPWGEAFDSANNCLYVTEDPATVATTGYVTAWGPSYPVQSFVIPGGQNPQGIAWARSFAWEPNTWAADYPGGILEVADTGSNAVSVFGVPHASSPAGPAMCDVVWLQTDSITDSMVSPGTPLQGPWDVVFAARPGLFYMTWNVSSVVTGLAGSNPVCETNSDLSNPQGLSYNGGTAINVANDQPAGYVTQVQTFAYPYCGPSKSSEPISPGVGGAVWTVSAPALAFNNTTLGPTKNVLAVSGSEYGSPGDVAGVTPINTGNPSGCALVNYTPAHVMEELNQSGVVLGCSNSVRLDGAAPPFPPSPGAYGNAYSPWTHRVYEVLTSADNTTVPGPGGTLEAVTWSAVYETITTNGTRPIEVIDFVPGAGTFLPTGMTSAAYPYYDAPADDGTLVVTNWGSGTLLIAPAF